MSWNAWDVNGYGIDEADVRLAYDEESISRLLDRAPVFKSKVKAQMDAAEIELFGDYEDPDYCHTGYMPLVTGALSEIEGITVEYHAAENGNFILFPPYYPWQAKLPNDDRMSTEKLDEIYMRYFGIEGGFVSAQFQG